MEKIVILFDKLGKSVNGIRVYCINLAKLLNETGLFYALPYDSLERFPITIFGKSIYMPKSIEKYISQIEPDYINVNGFMSFLPIQIIRIARKKKIPVIYTPHMHPFHTLNKPIIGKISFFLFLKPILKYFQKIVVINNEEYSFFVRYNPNCYLIPHWINKSYLPYDKCLHKFNNILFIGHSDPNKNLSFLYNLPKNRFIINCVTDRKPNREDFTFYINVSDEELDVLYDNAALVVVPSRYEAFSLVSLEALSHGTPVLISDRVKISDHLKDISGFTVFKYNDFADFQSKLEIALKSKVDIQKIASIFSKEKALDRYKKVFL